MYSQEVERALEEAARLASGTEITSLDMLCALAICTAGAKQILAKYGFRTEDAKSFCLRIGSGTKLNFSGELSAALVYAKKVAAENGGGKVYSQHLLLALVKKSGKEVRQALLDYGINGAEIEDIVRSMAFYKIGETVLLEGYTAFPVKRKVSFELTQRIYNVLGKQC